MSSPSKRRDMDMMKLAMAGHQIKLSSDENPADFHVKFRAPKDSLYENGVYNVHVTLPAQYPYRSPSIGFSTRIYHPNIDEASGSVCLDVINQTWSPMYDLLHVFTIFLPQLLLYPNPADPLNPQAASLYHNNRQLYEQKVRQHVQCYASKDFNFDDTDSEEDIQSECVSTAGCHTGRAPGVPSAARAIANAKTVMLNSSQSQSASYSITPNGMPRAPSSTEDDDEEPLSECEGEEVLSEMDDMPGDNEVAGSMEL